MEIITGQEDLQNCDGVFTAQKGLSLGIKTADCAAIAFYDNEKYGIIHAGWRGLVNGIVEKMLKNFTAPHVLVSPLLNEFEIQKDACFDQIENKFGKRYFRTQIKENGEIIVFEFQKALSGLLPNNAIFDSRNTFENRNLASWRRDGNEKRNYTIIRHQKTKRVKKT